MYSWQAMIGLILPSLNGIMEPECNAMAPDGVSIHATRLHLPSGPSLEDLKKMAEGTEGAAELLATAGVNIIAYACTSGSLVGGPGWDQQLISRIEKAASVPATTTSTAVIRACRELGVSKVALATPYDEATNPRTKEQIMDECSVIGEYMQNRTYLCSLTHFRLRLPGKPLRWRNRR